MTGYARYGKALVLAATAAWVGCVAPSGREEEVATQGEALNAAPNFNISAVVVTYLPNGINVYKGNVVTTASLANTALSLGSSSITNWATPGLSNPASFPNPTGIRVGLTPLSAMPFDLSTVDFRFTIEASDANELPGLRRATPWASQGGGWSDVAVDDSDQRDADFYSIGIDVRNWPGNQPKRLVDFQIGAQACDGSSFDDCPGAGTQVFSDWLLHTTPNTTSWSHTAGMNSGDTPDGMRIGLNVAQK